MIVHSTIGPLAKGTPLLDVAKAMAMAKYPYVLLEGQPVKMIDAPQVLRAIASANSVVELAEVLSTDAEQWAYEVPIVEEVEGPKTMIVRELGAVVLKGGNVVSSLYFLGKLAGDLPETKVKEIMDERPKVIDPLVTVREALLSSLAFGLDGYLYVGQGRIMGQLTPITFLEFYTRDDVVSMIERGEPSVMESVVGDLAIAVSNYYHEDAKIKDVATENAGQAAGGLAYS
ncbi:hypothetical protein IPA_01660 [Ignicoccus pacificus DSM 13166]|uniref:CBS domain-containing protein n=1 Tax=Ignicoccus pacificus DSM 13166 TaxID=940294 RepID=A0A977KAJ1_9CREN|nr:hypothetical protein IPA_01660 [Ignicoccus pacificus DSM 13166]